jgi:anti-sigma factor RsiW
MDLNDFEFLLTQYLDGTLSADQRQSVEQRLNADPQAKTLLEQYRKLDQALAMDSTTLEAIRWDRLSAHISDKVDERNSTPIFSFSWLSSAAAVAAMLLVVVGIWKVYLQQPAAHLGSPHPEVAMDVNVPEAAQTTDVVSDISIAAPQDPAVLAKYQTLSADKPVITLVGLSNNSMSPAR